jgi:regulatory protein
MMRKSRFGSKAGGERGRTDGSDSGRSSRSSQSSAGDIEREHERADAEQSASARFVSGGGVGREANREQRLRHARALLEGSLGKPRAKSAPAPMNPHETRRPARPQPTPPEPLMDADSLDPAEQFDPFEPFEQCAPPSRAVPASSSSPSGDAVYSRSSQGRAGRSSAAPGVARKQPQRTLKSRALGYLSRREYSRAELSRKLVPFADEADSLEALLDALEREGWLSNERFVESVLHRRAGRMGASRIVNELKRHDVGDALISETADKLAQTEMARARAIWSKKYGSLPQSPAERAKQARFLAARGFSSGMIVKILKGGDDEWGGDFTEE